jgi:uncharacterized protein with PIN domain
MPAAVIRFYEELNDFLPHSKRKVQFMVEFTENETVKSIIESENIPHAEVDLILINSHSVTFDAKVKTGDYISVYPVFESFDISSVQLIRLLPLRETRFVLDVHLGKLARYLRMMGFDTVWDNTYDDSEIVRISTAEKRTILTRDKKLLMRKVVERGYWIRNVMIRQQVAELIHRFDLENFIRWFTICTRCNGALISVSEDFARAIHPVHHFLPGTVFCKCTICNHIYWNGTHGEKVKRWIRGILNNSHPS